MHSWISSLSDNDFRFYPFCFIVVLKRVQFLSQFFIWEFTALRLGPFKLTDIDLNQSSTKFVMPTKRDLNRIKELKVEIPFYGELSTSESKEKESYKRLVIDLKKELETLEQKVGNNK